MENSETVETPVPAETEPDLAAERDRLAAEKDELYERLLRARAEFENYRRRVERERSELLEYAGAEAVREILPIVDDFERALQVDTADAEYSKGMQLIYGRLSDTLKKLGLEPITSVGQQFDPNVHHAVDMEQTTDADDHTVIGEYQKGYNFRGRLLRPAMVRVAVKPAA
jgi:molecular chaperone GrpE